MALRPSASTVRNDHTRGRWRRHRWSGAALLVFALLVGGSWIAASNLAHGEADKSQRELRASSAHVASTLQLAIQHEEDLIVSAGGFIAANPGASNRQFIRWASSVRSLQRYPELLSLGYVRMVSQAQLAGFAADSARIGPIWPRGVDQVVPPGRRPFYCFAVGGLQRSVQAKYPVGFDLCGANPMRAQVLAARDSGLLSYLPYQAGPTKTLAIFGPVYRGGSTPATVAARRHALLGWVGMTVVPDVLLAQARGRSDTAVTLRYRHGSSSAVFTFGVVPKHPQAVTIDLHNGWTVTNLAAPASSGVLADGGALALLGAGIALSVLLGLLVAVLSSGQARARRLVEEKTGELQVQAYELLELDEERQRLLARTVEVAEAERTGLAADLHDGPIQHLTAITLRLDLLASKLQRGDHENTVRLVNQLREAIAAEMVSLRRLMIELRPPMLDQRGIEVALRDCAQGVLGDSIQFELACTLDGLELAPELETAIYRVVREALTNIRKHAAADHARVTLVASEARVLLTISDDGSGFQPGRAGADRYGLITMREGVEAVGGTWRVETSLGSGTRIEAALPSKPRALPETGEPEREAA